MQAACKQMSLCFETVQLFGERALLEWRNIPPHSNPQAFSLRSYCWHWQKRFAKFPLCTCKFPQGTLETLGDGQPGTTHGHGEGLRACEMVFQAYLKVKESTGKTSHKSPCGFSGLWSLLTLWVSRPNPPTFLSTLCSGNCGSSLQIILPDFWPSHDFFPWEDVNWAKVFNWIWQFSAICWQLPIWWIDIICDTLSVGN